MPTLDASHVGAQVRRRGSRQLLVVVLILLVALTAAVAALHAVSGREATTTFTANGVRGLVVKVHAGRIDLTPSRDDTVQVTTTRRWSVWRPFTHHAVTGGVLTLTGGCPPLGTLGITRCAVDERVSVPAGTGVLVTVSTGDVIGTDLAVTDLQVTLSRGSVTASFSRPPDRILARLDAGTLRLTVPPSTYAVDATAAPDNAGHVAVDVPTDASSHHKISARISRGDIHILQR